MSDYKNYYKTLGVAENASADELKKAFRKLAQKWHPDRHQGASKEEAEQRFKEISEAYAILSDPEKRRQYDMGGMGGPNGFQGFSNGGGFDFNAPGFEGFEDILSSLFGGGMGRRGGRRQSGGFGDFFSGSGGMGGMGGMGGHPFGAQQMNLDIEAQLELSIEDTLEGGKRTVTFQRDRSGRPTTIEVNIPKGVTPGKKIRLRHQGHQGPGGQKGDLYLVIALRPHHIYRVEGSDLHVTVTVMPWTAALGGSIEVPTPDGAVMMTIPQNARNGQKLRLKHKGLGSGATRGHVYATLSLSNPETLTSEQRGLYEKLANTDK